MVMDTIRGRHAQDALDNLRYMHQRAARMVEKVLKSALGNAENRGTRHVEDMVIVEARADEGPMFKRLQPRARGMAYLIRRRSSHIHITVEEPNVPYIPGANGKRNKKSQSE